jgi:YegS/Rv2252/BmrU family lipid kinase
MKRAAVVANPIRIDDREKFRELIRTAMSAHGWTEPLWLETTVDDPGTGQARAAVAAQVDLLLASGGDGTITACAAAVAGTGIPLAVLPAGTGNLLARNLGLPLELDEALLVALTGTNRQLDVGCANDRAFLVMAGVGFDARIMDGASEPLKQRMGWAAYVLSGLRHLQDRPVRVTLRADSARPLRRRASAVIVGNVGSLQGGVPLLPDANPGDGLLDAVVLTARGRTAWLALAVHVLTRQRATSRLARVTFRELRVNVGRSQPWQIDGEVIGRTQRLVVRIADGKLLIRIPAATAG